MTPEEAINDLHRQVAELRQQLMHLEAQMYYRQDLPEAMHPLASRILLVSKSNAKLWQERTIKSAAIVDLTEGRKCDDDGDPSAIIPTEANTFLLAIRDEGTNADRYVEIPSVAVKWGKVKTAWTPASGTIELTPTVSDTDSTASGDADVVALVVRAGAANSVPIFHPDLSVGTHPVPYIPYGTNKGVCFPFAVTYSSTAALGTEGGSETADSTTIVDAEHKTVTLTKLFRTVYNAAGDQVLYDFYRDLVFKHGVLTSVSGETRDTVATPVECPEP